MLHNLVAKGNAETKYDRLHLKAPETFRQQLALLIKRPPEGSVKMTITPKMAGDMLALNTRNRPVSKASIKNYVRQMQNGLWRYTRVPIIFSDAGRLIDGQHRLTACVESDVSFDADVVFGAPDDAFDVIDVGKRRSAGDIFAINDVPNAKAMAAMSRILWHYQHGRAYVTGGTHHDLTLGQLYEFYITLPRAQDSYAAIRSFAVSRLATPSVMGAMHFICAQKNRAQADEFFRIVNDGGGDKREPAQELHKLLIRNATSANKMTSNHMAGLVLTAWNRSRRGVSGRGLSFDGQKLPAVQ